MSKFNVRVTGSTGAVVIGDHANLTVGATDGKRRKFPFVFDRCFHGLIPGFTCQGINLRKD